MKSRKLTDTELWTTLLLFLAILFGGIVRFAPAVLSDFPINDGGMFFVMTEELQANHYKLPEVSNYNGLQIPFAYPPLGFYLAGLSSDLFSVNLIHVFLWFPAIISTLALIAFYFLARNMLDSAPKGALATLFFALIPRSISWFLMGGGVTRTLGQLFLVLTVYSVFMTLARGSRRHLIWSMLFGGLACLSHPEAIIHAGTACFLLALFYVRSKRGILYTVLIMLGVLLVSSPWWLMVLSRTGIEPFITASQTGGYNVFFWLELMPPVFAEEKFVTLLTVLGLIGFAAELFKHRFFLPIWLIVPFAVEPRSASSIAIFPLALLAAISVSEVILPGLLSVEKKGKEGALNFDDWVEMGMKRNAVRIILGYVAVIALIGSFSYSLSLSNYGLSADDLAAMAWVAANTPPDSRFMLITGNPQPLGDPVQEWFPVIGNRKSQSTIQGLEWVKGEVFSQRLEEAIDLQVCTNREAECLTAWAAETGLAFDYIFVERYELVASYKAAILPEVPALLLASLRNSPDYELVYESDNVFIFAYSKAR
jgi:Dolichyl-phosphate-mannose-protein mannosyltransferase